MATAARAEIEALLRARKLDTTLTSAHPCGASETAGNSADDQYVVATGIAALDARLGGGFARGQLSEVVGPRSSGRTAVVFAALAGATSRGELVALIDTFDTFDQPSARGCGLDLTRLLWVRGRGGIGRESGVRPSAGSGRGELVEPRRPESGVGHRTSDDACLQSIDCALKACNLILQAGGFGLVVLDLADVPPLAIRRLPFTTWFRLQRPIEGSTTACVILASEPVARSAAGVTVALQRVSEVRPSTGSTAGQPRWGEVTGQSRWGGGPRPPVRPPHRDAEHALPAPRSWGALFAGFEVEARLGRTRGVAEACTFECRARP